VAAIVAEAVAFAEADVLEPTEDLCRHVTGDAEYPPGLLRRTAR
jgi:hypothetical protein